MVRDRSGSSVAIHTTTIAAMPRAAASRSRLRASLRHQIVVSTEPIAASMWAYPVRWTGWGQVIVGFEIVMVQMTHILAPMTPSAAENNAQPLPPALTWFLPNLSAWLWLILFLFLIADPQRTKLVSGDGDANMHWRVGEYMQIGRAH